MARRRPCCYDPLGFWHWPDEPGHVHAENLPSNHAQRGEVEGVPEGWTAQAQAQIDQLTTLVAEHGEPPEPEPEPIHRHTLKGQ